MEAERGRVLVEESREIVVVLDGEQRVVGASRRARESIPGLAEGVRLPAEMLEGRSGTVPLAVPYQVDGRAETLLYLSSPGDLPAYEELRAGFTAAVSHELRTPLARLLALIESALLPGADVDGLLEQARAEIEQIDELIGEVLFLSELETGREVVALGSTPVRPVIDEVVERFGERAIRADIRIVVDADPELELPLRARLLRVIVENLAENAIRYAGGGVTLTLYAHRVDGGVLLGARDDGAGVAEDQLSRLFERFFRADRARASRGTGLGLAIVKHIVTAAAGTVEARGGPGRGLDVRCTFPLGARGGGARLR